MTGVEASRGPRLAPWQIAALCAAALLILGLPLALTADPGRHGARHAPGTLASVERQVEAVSASPQHGQIRHIRCRQVSKPEWSCLVQFSDGFAEVVNALGHPAQQELTTWVAAEYAKGSHR